jgi:hypothetical protein
VTVGASAKDDTKAYFSNFGDDVEVYAPGQDIVGTPHKRRMGLIYRVGLGRTRRPAVMQ